MHEAVAHEESEIPEQHTMTTAAAAIDEAEMFDQKTAAAHEESDIYERQHTAAAAAAHEETEILKQQHKERERPQQQNM